MKLKHASTRTGKKYFDQACKAEAQHILKLKANTNVENVLWTFDVVKVACVLFGRWTTKEIL